MDVAQTGELFAERSEGRKIESDISGGELYGDKRWGEKGEDGRAGFGLLSGMLLVLGIQKPPTRC